jgi:Tol biopolymer transport system component
LNAGGRSRIYTVRVASDAGQLRAGMPEPFRDLTSANPYPTMSPDGRWVAYASSESGVYEVYVRAFPDHGRQWPVSTGGGSFPEWSRTANELFYRTEGQRLMVASFKVIGDTFVAEKPRVWSDKRLFNTGYVQNFDLAPDGKRFAVLLSADGEAQRERPRLMLALNFFDEVRRRVTRGGE